MRTPAIFRSVARVQKHVRRSAALLAATTVVMLAGGQAFGQTYHYRFTVNGITDPASAKELTDVLRSEFNAEDAPFKYFPDFSDAEDAFDFRSDKLVQREQLEALLDRENYVLQEWRLTENKTEE